MNIDWNNLRPISGKIENGFEEFVAQLAEKEEIPRKKQYIRNGTPDGGVENYWILEDDTEIAWQSKWFLSSLDSPQWQQIDDSVETMLKKHGKVTKYIIAIPRDLSDARVEKTMSERQKWGKHVEKWDQMAAEEGRTIVFELWGSSELIKRLQQSSNRGIVYFWFNKELFTDEWFSIKNKAAISNLGPRYTPEINIELEI